MFPRPEVTFLALPAAVVLWMEVEGAADDFAVVTLVWLEELGYGD